MDLTYPYRVFVGYAEGDRDAAARIVARLRELDVQPLWDQDNPGGWSYVKQTQARIAHSHLFIPFLTPRSIQSNWVNHEIGFAVGRGVPILPLSLGPIPDGMTETMQAEIASSVDDLLPRLTRVRISDVVEQDRFPKSYEFADLPEDRTKAIISYCKEFSHLAFGKPQQLRHAGAFGSFSLPADPHDPIWVRRYDGEPWRATMEARKKDLSEERQLLEAHAMRFGYDLIAYPHLSHLTAVANQARAEILRSSLVSLQKSSGPIRVIFDESALGGNLLVVGDWFCAQSMTPKADGYRHTTLTSHAPTVRSAIAWFDRWFARLGSSMSTDQAIDWLDRYIATGVLPVAASTS
jgi:hypothetical protein